MTPFLRNSIAVLLTQAMWGIATAGIQMSQLAKASWLRTAGRCLERFRGLALFFLLRIVLLWQFCNVHSRTCQRARKSIALSDPPSRTASIIPLISLCWQVLDPNLLSLVRTAVQVVCILSMHGSCICEWLAHHST